MHGTETWVRECMAMTLSKHCCSIMVAMEKIHRPLPAVQSALSTSDNQGALRWLRPSACRCLERVQMRMAATVEADQGQQDVT